MKVLLLSFFFLSFPRWIDMQRKYRNGNKNNSKRREIEKEKKVVYNNLFHYRFINSNRFLFSFPTYFIFIVPKIRRRIKIVWIVTMVKMAKKNIWKVSYLYLCECLTTAVEISQASSWVILLCRCGLPSHWTFYSIVAVFIYLFIILKSMKTRYLVSFHFWLFLVGQGMGTFGLERCSSLRDLSCQRLS